MKQKTPEIGAQARAQIAETLPQALDKAIASYHEFMNEPNGQKSNDFKNHHVACKAALAHIELLLKLAQMVDVEMDDKINHLEDLFKNARAELEGHNAI
jgi:3-dehydroquinate dehydratase